MMSYRFVRVTNYYPQHIKNYYQCNPSIGEKSYSEQYEHLISDSVETVSSYSRSLNKQGVMAFDIISNADVLQNTWKKENNLPAETAGRDIVIEQLKYYRPDVAWIDDFSIVSKEWKEKLLKEVPTIKLIIGHICAPYNSILEEKFRLFDIMFTCIPCFEKELNALGIKTYLLYHGFDTTVLEKLKKDNHFNGSDFLFSGSLYTGSGFHKSRIECIEKILLAGIKMDLYCNLESRRKNTVKKMVFALIRFLRKFRLERTIEMIPLLKKYEGYGNVPVHYYSDKLISRIQPPVFGMEMFQLLSKAKICFNSHGEVATKCAGNIRLFEATGVGTCLVTDWKENLGDLFELEKEVVTYKTPDECIRKVQWLLNNPDERKKIAMAGQERTLAEHTIEKRAGRMNEIISNELNKFA
ncbi:MAG: glycosyltransferase [Bacteroidetes bacterium]|nr:glycosyltransferase [Bacteroidota bacterium]